MLFTNLNLLSVDSMYICGGEIAFFFFRKWPGSCVSPSSVPILIRSSQTDNQARLPCIQSWDLILKPVLLHSTLTDLLSGLTCPVSDKEIGQLQNLILESAESAANIFVYVNT